MTMSPFMAPYRFQKLESGQQQIRLLHLQAGEFHEPIWATLSLANLDDHPKYEALSYVWGDPKVCLDITLDGHKMPVTPNLWAALRRLRAFHQQRVLWVDAICINQADENEKSDQVGLMTLIYKTTWRGIAWLGEFEEDAVLPHGSGSHAVPEPGVTMGKSDARKAFESIKRLSRLTPDGHFTFEDNETPGWVQLTQSDITAVNRLMGLSYLSRVWTVQEFVLPPRVALMLGNILCEEPSVLLADIDEWDFWKHHPLYGQCCETFIAQLPQFPAWVMHFYDRLQSLREIMLPMPLGEAVNRFRIRYCTDPRDKVFGLLGLAHPMTTQLIDYTLNKNRVYTKYIRYDIVSTGSLHPLMRVSESSRDTSLPSWVPDLAAAVLDNPGLSIFALELQYIGACPSLFSAGTQRGIELGTSREDDELHLGGRRVDTIRSILWQNGAEVSHVLMPKLRATWHGLLESDPHLNLNNYPSGGNYQEAFWRTFSWDAHVARDLNNRAMRITAGNEERVKKELDHDTFLGRMNSAKTFFVTQQGYIGVGPEHSQVGDVLYVLFGGHVPFLLRERSETQDGRGTHTFVGHAYVHGIMDGQALENNNPDEQVVIV